MVPFVLHFDRRAVRPSCSLVNPRAQQSDLVGGQAVAFLRHHFVLAFEAGDELDHQTLPALAWLDDRAVLAAFDRDVLGVPAQFGLGLFRSVALVAAPGENRLNVFYEVNFAVRRRRQHGNVRPGSFCARAGKQADEEKLRRRENRRFNSPARSTKHCYTFPHGMSVWPPRTIPERIVSTAANQRAFTVEPIENSAPACAKQEFRSGLVSPNSVPVPLPDRTCV